MDRINEHLDQAHYHLIAAAMLLEQQFHRDYCRDVPNGRILGLFDLHAKGQEAKRLAAATRALTPETPVGLAEPIGWAVPAECPGPSSHLDHAA